MLNLDITKSLTACDLKFTLTENEGTPDAAVVTFDTITGTVRIQTNDEAYF